MKPEIDTPEFWPVDNRSILKQIATIKKGKVEKIGYSAGRRDLYGVTYEPASFSIVFGIISGMHGHEPGGVAAAFNLINILENGRDLKNKKWKEVSRLLNEVKFVIVPLLNPDARFRCPDSFVGLSYKDIQIYCEGLDLQGRPVKRKNFINTKRTSILGGLYNDKGIDIFNYGKKDYKNCPEMAYCVDLFQREGVEYFINLHAHSFKIMFYSPHACISEEEMKRELYITREVRKRGGRAGLEFARTEYEMKPCKENMVKIDSELLVYNHCRALPFLIECPQGTVDSYRCHYGGKEREIKDPGYSHEKIVASYLFVIQEINNILRGGGKR